MNPHALSVEEETPAPSGIAVKSECLCGLLFVAVAATARGAKQVIRRKLRDHRGQAMAAGPGWQM